MAVAAADALIVAAADVDGGAPCESVADGVVVDELAAVADTDAVVDEDAEAPCVSDEV